MPVAAHDALYRAFQVKVRMGRERLRKTIVSYYDAMGREQWNTEQAEIVAYYRNHPFTFIPYSWDAGYAEQKVKIYKDTAKKMRYVVLDDIPIYFARGIGSYEMRKLVRELTSEQDPRSPHRYMAGHHCIQPGDVVADVGAAEAIFSRGAVDTASHIYVFESDPDWRAALEETFRGYNGKVTIVSRHVSNKDDNVNLTLDAYFNDKPPPDFLKVDVEGAEPEVLQGAARLFSAGKIQRASICTYHHPAHADAFMGVLRDAGYHTAFSPGLLPNRAPPYLVKGVLWAHRT
jgi:hypothetical protein